MISGLVPDSTDEVPSTSNQVQNAIAVFVRDQNGVLTQGGELTIIINSESRQEIAVVWTESDGSLSSNTRNRRTSFRIAGNRSAIIAGQNYSQSDPSGSSVHYRRAEEKALPDSFNTVTPFPLVTPPCYNYLKAKYLQARVWSLFFAVLVMVDGSHLGIFAARAGHPVLTIDSTLPLVQVMKYQYLAVTARTLYR